MAHNHRHYGAYDVYQGNFFDHFDQNPDTTVPFIFSIVYLLFTGRQQGRNSLHEPYVKEAIRELKCNEIYIFVQTSKQLFSDVVECRICTEMIENKHFLKHVKDCAQKFNASFYKVSD